MFLKIEESKMIAFVEANFCIKIKKVCRKEVLKRIVDILKLKVDEKLKESGFEGLNELLKDFIFANYSYHSGLKDVSEEYLKNNFSINLLNPEWFSYSEKKYAEETDSLFKATAFLSIIGKEKNDYKYDHVLDILIYLNRYLAIEERRKLEDFSDTRMMLTKHKTRAESISAKIYISKIERIEAKEGFLNFMRLLHNKVNFENIKSTMERDRSWYVNSILSSLKILDDLTEEILKS